MPKKNGPSRTRQGVGGGVSIAEAHRRYGNFGDGNARDEEINTYLATMRNAKYIGNDKVEMTLTRNQRRLAKKLGLDNENK
ncbi:hypothetical protein NRE95_001214 [Salmonella enterica]|nr:hypothetical protein [Salmonella enterica]